MTMPIDETDAMLVAALATEVFHDLLQQIDAYDPPPDIARGAALFYGELLKRTQPFLPRRESLAHVQRGIAEAQKTAAAIRANLGMPVAQ